MTDGAWPEPCCSWHGQERRRMEVNQEAEGKDPEAAVFLMVGAVGGRGQQSLMLRGVQT